MRLFCAILTISFLTACGSTPSKPTYAAPVSGPLAKMTVTAYTQGLYFGGRNPEISFWVPGSDTSKDVVLGRYQFNHKDFGVESISIKADKVGYFVAKVSEAGQDCSVPFSFKPIEGSSYNLHFELKNFKCSIEIKDENGVVVEHRWWPKM